MAFFEVYPPPFFFNLMTFICLVTLCVLEEFQVFAFYCMWHLMGMQNKIPTKWQPTKLIIFVGTFLVV